MSFSEVIQDRNIHRPSEIDVGGNPALNGQPSLCVMIKIKDYKDGSNAVTADSFGARWADDNADFSKLFDEYAAEWSELLHSR